MITPRHPRIPDCPPWVVQRHDNYVVCQRCGEERRPSGYEGEQRGRMMLFARVHRECAPTTENPNGKGAGG